MRFVGEAWRSCATLLRSLTRTTGNIMGHRGFAACGRRGTFPAMGKYPKDRRGTPQRRTSFANDGFPPVPHYGGHPLGWAEHFRRAKSGVLGCGSFRATGPWVCGKLELVRFRFCACRFRTNVPRLFSAVGAHSVRPRAGLGPAPTGRPERSPVFRRGGTLGRPEHEP